MRYKLKVYSIWEYGQRVDSEGKPHQEDNIFPAYEQQKESDRLFILCDGMGGHEAGEVASSTVCSAMSKSIFDSAPNAEGDFNDDNLRKAIADAFDSLDALPLGDVSAEKKMGTTMTFLKFHNKGCTIAHMGDSRVYHIRPGKGRDETKILFKTNDHSLVNDLIKVGELTQEEAKLSKQKNIITRAMQPKMERRPKPDIYHTVDIKPGDYFYMCSDGMLEQMEDENLLFNFSEATGDDENKVKILTQATSQNLDNHSAIIIHILDVIDPLPLETVVSAPIAVKPEPIMAEINEDSQVESDNTDRQGFDDINGKDKTPVSELTKSDNGNIMNLDNTRDKSVKSTFGVKKIRFIRYIALALIVVLLAFGIFFVSSKLSKKQNGSPDKIETPQKPAKNPHRKHQNNSSAVAASPQQSQNSQDEESTAKPNSGSSSGETNSAVTSIHNVLSSHNNPSRNEDSGSHSQQSNGANQVSHSNGIDLNNISHQDDGVVSSDQQLSIDAVKKNKKK